MTTASTRVLIAGGGVAALEAALALRALAYDRVTVELLAQDTHFVYRPLAVGEPFGGGEPWRFELAEIAQDRGFALRHGTLAGVDVDRQVVTTEEGEEISYDALVLALGACMRSPVAGALTFRGSQDAAELAGRLRGLDRDGRARVAFVAVDRHGWMLPMYELALLTCAWAREEGIELEVSVASPESEPLEAFGPGVSQELRGLLGETGVELRMGARADEIDADLVVALPRLDGPRVPGLPSDSHGFAIVDEHCRVKGTENVYAVGDMANWPIKQGGLAAQQADVAAAAIAAGAGAPVDTQSYRPVLRGLLMTGDRLHWLRQPQAPAGHRPDSALGGEPLWWPRHKIAAAHLAPYLAANSHLAVRAA